MTTYKDLENKLIVYLPGIEKALKVVLATAIASRFQFPVMIWLLLVDVPSSGKTDLVRLLKDSTNTYYLDNMTTNAFVSGERATKSNKVHDLLPELDKKCFIVKDWTSIFSMDEKATKKLIGDLVNIYDKEFAKFSSARGMVRYDSYFSHLGCITPATLNKHTNYLNMIGARFLFYNLPEVSATDEELSLKRIFSNNDRTNVENMIRQHVSSYYQQLLEKVWNIKSLSSEVQRYITIGARLIAHCRGIVYTQTSKFITEDNKEATSYDVLDSQIEKPWRALLQLLCFSQCLAFTVGNDQVGIDELEVIKNIVLASMPVDRSKALQILKKHNGIITAKELAEDSERSYKTSKRLLEELHALGVIEKIPGSGQTAADYKIRAEFKDFICETTGEFMSTYSSGTETPHNPPTNSKVEENTYNKIENINSASVIPPWEKYLLKNPLEELGNEDMLAMLEVSKTYSIGETIPLGYKQKFYVQALELEEECKKRNIL